MDAVSKKKRAYVEKTEAQLKESGKESTGGDYEAFVSAQSRNPASLSREIAETILQLSN